MIGLEAHTHLDQVPNLDRVFACVKSGSYDE